MPVQGGEGWCSSLSPGVAASVAVYTSHVLAPVCGSMPHSRTEVLSQMPVAYECNPCNLWMHFL